MRKEEACRPAACCMLLVGNARKVNFSISNDRLNTRQPNAAAPMSRSHESSACRHISVSLLAICTTLPKRRNGCQVSCAFFHLVCRCARCSCILMRGLDFNTIFTLRSALTGPFTSRVPFIPSRATPTSYPRSPSTPPASSAENLTALTWLLCPLNLWNRRPWPRTGNEGAERPGVVTRDHVPAVAGPIHRVYVPGPAYLPPTRP